MLLYENIKHLPKVFTAFTSLTVNEFEQLLETFEVVLEAFLKQNETQTTQRQKGGGRKQILPSAADHLLLILFYMKTYPIQEVVAFLFRMSQSQVNY